MDTFSVASHILEVKTNPRERLDQFFCLEIMLDRPRVIYQFKIWRTDSSSVFILIKENSGILPWVKVGRRLAMKFYPIDTIYTPENLDTEILSITKQNLGSMKSHYLVRLDVLGSSSQKEVQLPGLEKRLTAEPENTIHETYIADLSGWQ